MAVLPQLGGTALTTARSAMGVHRERETRDVEWVFDLPSKAIAEGDEMLMQHRTTLEAEAGYEQLCKFYVALTRARYANYLIAAPRKAKSTSRNFIKLLDDTLAWEEPKKDSVQGISFNKAFESELSTSDSRWWEHLPKKKVKPAPEPQTVKTTALTPRPRPERRTPSQKAASRQDSQLFSTPNQEALDLGTEVHALFEKMPWWQPDWALEDRSLFQPTALEHFDRVIDDSACQEELSEPFLEDCLLYTSDAADE